MILKKISFEVKECVYFSILVDETKDITKTEQLSVVLRYFFEGEIKERFLGFTPLIGLDANSLFLKIKEMLLKCQIDINNCVAQTYDGASVMRGHINGVQTIFRKEVPQAYYMHCANHRLNLVLVDIAKNIEEADTFFALVQNLYVLFSGSNIHVKFIELQKQVLNIKPIELKRLCFTRWSSQIHSCKAIKNTIEVVLLLLNQLAISKNDRNLEAKTLLKQINFKFVYLLLFFNDLLSHIHGVNLYLQDVKADISKAMVLIETTKQLFNDLRNEIPHKKLFNEAETLSIKLNIDLPSSQKVKKRVKKLPTYLMKYVCETNNIEKEQNFTSENEFRFKIYYCILDKVLNELDKRFNNNSDILNGVSSLDPQSKLFLNIPLLLPFAQSYNCDIETLKSELQILPKSLQNYENKFSTKINDIFTLYDFLNEYQIAFAQLYKLCLISITIPVSSAGCERTFSCLKRVKNYLRNKLMDTHMSNLSIIAIEKYEAKNLNINDIINEFASLHKNRRIILI